MKKYIVHYAENRFYAAKICRVEKRLLTVDLIRRQPILSGSSSLLIDFLAPLLDPAIKTILVFSPKDDFFLLQDLQLSGLGFFGFLSSSSEGGDKYNLWDGIENLELLPLQKINSKNRCLKSTRRFVLKFNSVLYHDHTFGRLDYLDHAREWERYFSSLTNIEFAPNKKFQSGRHNYSVAITRKRKISDFGKIAAKRCSAKSFSGAGVPEDELNTMLIDSFWRRADGHHPFASAGGIGGYRIILSVSSTTDGRRGVFVTAPDESGLKEVSKNHINHELFLACSKQDYTKNASVWIAIVADTTEIMNKYGSRG